MAISHLSRVLFVLILPMGVAMGQSASPTPSSAPAPPPTPVAVAAAVTPDPSPTPSPVPVAQPVNTLPVTPIPLPPAPVAPIAAVPADDSTGMTFSAPKIASPAPAPAAPPLPSISSVVSVPITGKPAVVAPSPNSAPASPPVPPSGHVGQFDASPLRDDWLISSDLKNRQDAKGYTLTTKVTSSSPDLGTGTTTQNLQTEYQRFLGNWGTVQIDSNLLQPENFDTAYTAQSIQEEQRMTVTEAPAENWTWSQELHHTGVTSNDITSGSETFGGGWSASANHQTPLNTDWKLDSQLDFTQAPAAANQETGKMGLELRQPLFNAPLAAVFTGNYTDTKDPSNHDFMQAQAPALEQALEWTAQPDTKMKFGFREEAYANMESLTAQKSQGVFAHLTQSLLPDLTLNSDLEYQRSRQDTLLPDPTTGSPTSFAGTMSTPVEAVTAFQDRSVELKFGPSFQLQQDISASLEFSNKWDDFSTGTSGSEQRISMSFKGTF